MSDERMISYAEAIREGLVASMAKDDRVFLMGEGIEDPVPFYGTTSGVAEEFGADRIVEMPVAENGMTGIAIGAALSGQRPVISYHRVEFALLAFEQIANNAAKSHYVSNGHHSVPLVIRLIIGRGWGQGPEHSQSLETLFSYIPGLKVVMPTFPGDAKGMLAAAIEDDNPVIFYEHRWLHYSDGHVPDGYCVEPLDGPRVVREGKDVTIVATGYMTLEAIRAAEVFAEHDCAVEVVDLRVLRPLIMEPIVKSVKKTGRILTVDTGSRTYGIGAEITASAIEHCFDSMKAAPQRMGLPDHPTPSSRGLIDGFYPDSIGIALKVGELMGMDEKALAPVLAELHERTKDLAIDTPDPYFKGPF